MWQQGQEVLFPFFFRFFSFFSFLFSPLFFFPSTQPEQLSKEKPFWSGSKSNHPTTGRKITTRWRLFRFSSFLLFLLGSGFNLFWSFAPVEKVINFKGIERLTRCSSVVPLQTGVGVKSYHIIILSVHSPAEPATPSRRARSFEAENMTDSNRR